MSSAAANLPAVLESRARQSRGSSADAIYRMVAKAVRSHVPAPGGALVDVGCGAGHLWQYLRDRFDRYVGVDVVRYEALPGGVEFAQVDLDSGRVPLSDASGDVVAAVETIEHLENPRSFVRELVRLAKPGGLVLITTPNQLSVLSKLTLVLCNEFNAFRSGSYPAHRTALLEVDLRRIAAECNLGGVEVSYSERGRIVFTGLHYPRLVSRSFPRGCSDNVLLLGRKLG